MGVRSEQRWVARCIREHQAVTDKQRELEALRLPRKPRKAPLPPPALPSQREVRAWMRRNVEPDEGPTVLAQCAASELGLPVEWLDDGTHWIWDEALEACEWAGWDCE